MEDLDHLIGLRFSDLKTKEKEATLKNQLIQMKLQIEKKALEELLQKKDSLLGERRSVMLEGQNENNIKREKCSLLLIDKQKKEHNLEVIKKEYGEMEDHKELKAKLDKTKAFINLYYQDFIRLAEFVKEIEKRDDVYNFRQYQKPKELIYPKL